MAPLVDDRGGPAREPSKAKTIDSSAVRITGDVTRGGDITGDIIWLTGNYMDREIITAVEQRTVRRLKTDVLSTIITLSANQAMTEFVEKIAFTFKWSHSRRRTSNENAECE